MWHSLVSLASGEFMLRRRSNGGSIILARSLFTATIAYAFCLLVRELVSPGMQWEFSSEALRKAIFDTLPWFGAIFAGIYAAYYARFASQWNYLANLYNQIKATESQLAVAHDSDGASLAFAEWKAGFVEDAEALHLSGKPLFAPVIAAWLEDPLVRYTLQHSSPEGERLLESLKSRVPKIGPRASLPPNRGLPPNER